MRKQMNAFITYQYFVHFIVTVFLVDKQNVYNVCIIMQIQLISYKSTMFNMFTSNLISILPTFAI